MINDLVPITFVIPVVSCGLGYPTKILRIAVEGRKTNASESHFKAGSKNGGLILRSGFYHNFVGVDLCACHLSEGEVETRFGGGSR